MDPQESDEIRRQLDAMWATHLRWLAAQDPTLTRLQQALAQGRAILQMDARTLLAFVLDLEARFST